MKKAIALILAIMMLFSILSGCGNDVDPSDSSEPVSGGSTKAKQKIKPVTTPTAPSTEGKTVLRVLVDKESDESTLFREQLNLLIKNFSAQHSDVAVVLEEIPTIPAERSAFVQRLNAELMTGTGPDVLILQNVFTYNETNSGKKPLFEDANLAMKNGILYDLSDFYDNDADLHTEKLSKPVMDAGVMDGARYILPISFNMPVLLVNKEAFENSELSGDLFDGTVVDLLNAVADMDDDYMVGDFALSGYMFEYVFNLLPQLLDYDSGKVSVTQGDIEAFLTAYQRYQTRALNVEYREGIRATSFKNFYGFREFADRDSENDWDYIHWTEEGIIMCPSDLVNSFAQVSMAKKLGAELEMYPLRGLDGSVVADVQLYGAVSAGCKNTELAYEFLRTLLTEKYQWSEVDFGSIDESMWFLGQMG